MCWVCLALCSSLALPSSFSCLVLWFAPPTLCSWLFGILIHDCRSAPAWPGDLGPMPCALTRKAVSNQPTSAALGASSATPRRKNLLNCCPHLICVNCFQILRILTLLKKLFESTLKSAYPDLSVTNFCLTGRLSGPFYVIAALLTLFRRFIRIF